METPSIAKLFEEQLREIYSAETQLVEVLPKMAKIASSRGLKRAIISHLEETKHHVDRLKHIGQALGITLKGKSRMAMEGLIEEGARIIDAERRGPVVDAALILAVRRIERYEISAYDSARVAAAQLGHHDVVKLLAKTLREEAAAAEILKALSEQEILPAAAELEDIVAF
jgi:ferritin-like metal-binding protein YciE